VSNIVRREPYRERNVAAFLAFFLGSFGIHRFYLGQKGKGILYLLFSMTGIPAMLGVIDAILIMVRTQEEFDEMYNQKYIYQRQANERPSNAQPTHREVKYKERNKNDSSYKNNDKVVDYKADGIAKFKDYDFKGAIESFNKALKVTPQDVACHFNLACAYSYMEDKEKAFYHLDKAVENGFVDFDKIHSHDAFAYIRVQDDFDQFVANRYRLAKATKAEVKNPIESMDLLEQIKRLGELKERGLLTDAEFDLQKKKLLG